MFKHRCQNCLAYKTDIELVNPNANKVQGESNFNFCSPNCMKAWLAENPNWDKKIILN